MRRKMRLAVRLGVVLICLSAMGCRSIPDNQASDVAQRFEREIRAFYDLDLTRESWLSDARETLRVGRFVELRLVDDETGADDWVMGPAGASGVRSFGVFGIGASVYVTRDLEVMRKTHRGLNLGVLKIGYEITPARVSFGKVAARMNGGSMRLYWFAKTEGEQTVTMYLDGREVKRALTAASESGS